MKKRRFVPAVAGLVLAVGVPAAVLAGGNAPQESNLYLTGGETTWATDGATSTNGRAFKPVRGLARWTEATLDYEPATAIHVAVDMRSGKGKLRLVDAGEFGAVIRPSSVLLNGKGIHTATFLLTGGLMSDPIVQWKRLGNGRLRAASVVVDVVGDLD